MKKLVLIDGNSIINRAFYGIMGNKALMTKDGIYTNGVYGFLAIYFKIIEDIKPEYIAIAFDLKAPTKRHELYNQYKGTRKPMPTELAQQLPILKEILRAMNITIIEKEGYEADDILGTLAKFGQQQSLDVTILTGDRDSFQLIDENIKVRIPRTKMGKTETEDYDVAKIKEEYGLNPLALIEVKGLMGDTSDNIPGVPGVGEKTAIDLIKRYNSIDEIYNKIENNEDDIKGKLREKLVDNKEIAYLSKTLGTIDINAPIPKNLEEIELKPWDEEKVIENFKKLGFNRFMDRFNLNGNKNKEKHEYSHKKIEDEKEISKIIEKNKKEKIIFYYLDKSTTSEEQIFKEKIDGIYIYDKQSNVVNYIQNIEYFKDVFESKEILKCSYKLKEQYLLLKQNNINPQNLMFDIEIAAYLLNATESKYTIENISKQYLDFDIDQIDEQEENKESQMTLFQTEVKNTISQKKIAYTFAIGCLYDVLIEKLKKEEQYELFSQIEMPLSEVLAEMQYTGMYIDKQELLEYGTILQKRLEELSQNIYNLAEQEFNINSPKQLGEILFEKLKLPVQRKNKSGYSTDVEVLEKLKNEHPIIEQILEYRQVAKLNSTYVEGLVPYISKKTNRIHSHFHQTVTATGRISSTDPNLQNIPTRMELGRKLRKVFKQETSETIYLDADYSQIELRILAHISADETMIQAFNNNEDIHTQAASKVFGIPIEEVTKDLRSKAKAVNFGIVYGISDFGLAEQIGSTKKEAKQYIEQYLEKYSGIKEFMDNIIEKTKELGYVETLYKRRRYVPELKSSNYMIRQFGSRVAMNTPIQGTAADIMKIAMINVYNELKNKNLKSKIVLQVHDELLIETYKDEVEIVKDILKKGMENVIKLKVPLSVEIEEGNNWFEAK